MSQGPAYDTKEQIRQAVDIVDLMGGYLQLRRQGRGYVAICPWHDDTRPSLQINPDRQSWKCWVCDIGGDIFSFMMQREGVDFREALAMLADRAGVSLQGPQKSPQAPAGSPGDKRTLYQAMAWAEQQFHDFLLRSPEAENTRSYLEDRGVTPQSVERFHLGCCPDQWTWLLDRARSTPYSPQVLEAVGLAIKSSKSDKYFDRFGGRLIFPIRDTQHRAIGLGGRVMPAAVKAAEAKGGRIPPKYINSPETKLFSKSDQLYGLDIVRDHVAKSREVVVVEGYTDVLMAHQVGLSNVVAVLGTALGPRHIRLLRRFADSIILVLDGDEAGRRRTNEVLELFVAAEVDLRILTLPQGMDPCDYLLRHGAEAFRKLTASASDALEHKIRISTQGIDLANDTHRSSQALEEILSTLAKAPRLQSTAAEPSGLRQQQILSRLSRIFRIDEEQLRDRLKQLRRSGGQRRELANENLGEAEFSIHDLTPTEVELLEILTQHPELTEAACLGIKPQQLESQVAKEIYQVYNRRFAGGEESDFLHVLTELEEPSLKNVLVELDERANKKTAHASEDARSRLEGLIQKLSDRENKKRRREELAAMEEKRFDASQELDALQQLIEQQRNRHSASSPTDG